MKKRKLSVCIAAIAMGIPALAAQRFTREELAYMPATTQIEFFKAGVITPTDVLEGECEGRVQGSDPCDTVAVIRSVEIML